MRKALRLLRPTSRRELARALAIIRPAAGEARRRLGAEAGEDENVGADASEEATRERKMPKQELVNARVTGHADAEANCPRRLCTWHVDYIKKVAECSEAEAEMYRRAFAKRNESGIAEFEAALHATNRSGLVAEAQALLKDAGKYSFCKSHAMSYAHLCWALAVEKACNLRKFWEAHRSVVANEGPLPLPPVF
ncbi:hypothetical protein T484DRAFT_1769297 [Baffinella frigidus]|nr:hypothetical protein T484DRAFT_1769297 [Cryptophyta sp. CCMP2293]